MVSSYKNLPIIYVSHVYHFYHVLLVFSMLKSFPDSQSWFLAMTMSHHPGPGGCLFEVLVEDEPPKARALRGRCGALRGCAGKRRPNSIENLMARGLDCSLGLTPR